MRIRSKQDQAVVKSQRAAPGLWPSRKVTRAMFVTAEVRWFYQDECPENLHRWFGETSPAPGGGKLRVDQYFFQTYPSEVSIKMRGGRPGVEIKGLVAICRGEAMPCTLRRTLVQMENLCLPVRRGDLSESVHID